MLRYDAAGGVRSEGRRLLLRALVRSSQGEIARRCGVSQSCISRLATGAATDSFKLRRALEQQFGIPAMAWDLAPENALHVIGESIAAASERELPAFMRPRIADGSRSSIGNEESHDHTDDRDPEHRDDHADRCDDERAGHAG